MKRSPISTLAVCAIGSGLALLASCSSMSFTSTRAQRDAVLAELPKTPLLTLRVENMPVEVVLKKMTEATGVKVATAETWLAQFPTSIDVKDVTLAQGLTKLLGNLDYKLKVERGAGGIRKVVIKAEIPRSEPPPETDRALEKFNLQGGESNRLGIVEPLLR